MVITIPYLYTTEVIPPRCRKPRKVEQSATLSLRVREVTSQEAPIAVVEHDRNWIEPGRWEKATAIYRWYRRKLYIRASFQRYAHAPRETQTASQFAADPYPFRLAEHAASRRHCTREENIRDLRDWAHSVLFIDGDRWHQTEEPRYVVMTFGLGNNHGLGWGTELSTSNGYNPNISRSRYYRADDYEAALTEATRVAVARGDTKALPVERVQQPTRFEIRIPEAIRLRPRRR